MDKMLTAEEVAKIVGCCESTAYTLMRKMPHFSPPGRSGGRKLIRVWQSDLLAFIANNTVDPFARKGGRKPAPKVLPILDADLFEPDGRIKRRRA